MDTGGFWLLFWIAFVILLVPRFRHAAQVSMGPTMRQAASRLRQTATTSVTGRPVDDPALRILRQRFAQGDIDRAEYEMRRDVLLAPLPNSAPRSLVSAGPVTRV